jgi:hypothetical protein
MLCGWATNNGLKRGKHQVALVYPGMLIGGAGKMCLATESVFLAIGGSIGFHHYEDFCSDVVCILSTLETTAEVKEYPEGKHSSPLLSINSSSWFPSNR